MSEAKRPTFLNLDDLAPEPTLVQIAGKKYRLRQPDSFGLRGAAQIAQLEARFAQAQQRFEADPSDLDAAEECEAALSTLVKLLLEDLPQEEADALPFAKKVRLLAFFEECYPELVTEARLRYSRRKGLTGATSSRGSRSGTVSRTAS